MIKVIINGAEGFMGKAVTQAVNANPNFEIAAKVDAFAKTEDCLNNLFDFTKTADVIIDFSHHSAVENLLNFAVERQIPTLIATTGHSEEEQKLIKCAQEKVAIFHSANMSIGVANLIKLAKQAAQAMPNADIEIVETHHNRKLDAPSGTALMIAKDLKEVRNDANFVYGRSGQNKREKNDITISAIRRGNIVGIHEVLISTENETLTLKHEAHSRLLFADGALQAAEFLAGKPAGLYTMKDII